MHQAKITKTDKKSNPERPKFQLAVVAAAATLQTCAPLNFCSYELCVLNELWRPIFILLLLSCLGQLLILEAKNSILNIFFSQLFF
jgi:hypothetical protein